MSELHLIEATLARTAQRRRLERGFRRFWEALFWGATAWFVLLAAYKLLPIPAQYVRVSWIVLPASSLLGFLWGWSRPVTLAQTARWIDGQRKLQERLSTALELGKNGREEGNWKALVVSDAAKAAAGVNPKELLPFKFPKLSRWALVLVLAGVG